MATATLARKEAHAEGVEFLCRALDLIDQADAQFRDAGTRGLVEGRRFGLRIDTRDMVTVLESALESARGAKCEDCDEPIADCNCYYSKAVR